MSLSKDLQSARFQIAEIIQMRYPNVDISFSGTFVTVNGIETKLLVSYIKNYYIGVAGLASHKKAVKEVSKMLIKKFDGLFFSKDN